MVVQFCLEIEEKEVEVVGGGRKSEGDFIERQAGLKSLCVFVCVCALNGAFCSNVTHHVQATVGA